jgi:hypothetical protein
MIVKTKTSFGKVLSFKTQPFLGKFLTESPQRSTAHFDAELLQPPILNHLTDILLGVPLVATSPEFPGNDLLCLKKTLKPTILHARKTYFITQSRPDLEKVLHIPCVGADVKPNPLLHKTK